MDDSRLCVTFTDVSREDFEALRAAESRTAVRNMLAECLKVREEEGLHAVILLDFHYSNWVFCLENEFNAEKSSTVLSIMKLVYERAVSQRQPQKEAYDLFRGLVLKHSCQRPPYSIGIFQRHETRLLLEYAKKTLFHHYKMYLHLYKSRYEIDVKQVSVLKEEVAGVMHAVELVPLDAGCVIDPRRVPELASLVRKQPKAPTVATDAQAVDAIFGHADQRHAREEKHAGSVRRAVDQAADDVLEDAVTRLQRQTMEFVQEAKG